MILLIAGMLIFIGVHMIPSFPSFRAALEQRFGIKAFLGIFSVIALFSIILIAIGKGTSEYQALWQTPPWGKQTSMLLMPIAFILLVASHMPNSLKRYMRHPMLWGIIIWAMAHLFVNGDLASVVLFGGFGIFSLFAMWSANRRGINLRTEAVVPFKNNIIVTGVGLLMYLIFVYLHPFLFGVAVIT